MFNSQTCLNSQPVAIGTYFGLKSWRQDGTARVIITSARFACMTGGVEVPAWDTARGCWYILTQG